MTPAQFLPRLLDAASQPYQRAGRFAWHFARGKLGGDPAFRQILERGLIPDGARVLDLGCGQGLLASWLSSAQRLHDGGQWPAGWPAAPRVAALRGIELMPRDVERARDALSRAADSRAEFVQGDIRDTPFGAADVVVILDVLHYLDLAAQDQVLRRCRDALAPRGLLLLRIGDAAAGLPFRISNWVDHLVTFSRGHRLARFTCRSLAQWTAALTALGFRVEPLPMSAGTPFANIMLVARLGGA
jgi:SAM-dependent methyltransferase